MVQKLFLFSVFLGNIWAQSGEEILEKHGLTDPDFKLDGLDFSSLTKTVDSSVYFYQGTTNRLDSMHQLYEFMSPAPEYRKATFSYVKSKMGRYEREIKVDTKTNEVIYDETRQFDKHDKLLSVNTLSESMGKSVQGNTYDERGNRIRTLSFNNENKVVGDNSFEYDSQNRMVKWINNSYTNERYRKYYYTDFDSLSAESNVYPEENREDMFIVSFFNSEKLLWKSIHYAFDTVRSPQLIWYHQYDSLRRKTNSYLFQWLDTTKPWRMEDMTLRWRETYEDDSRNRLKRKIIREVGFDD